MSAKTLNTIGQIAGYCNELYQGRDEIVDAAQTFPIEDQTAQYLIDYSRPSTAGTTLLCRQIYDIAYPGQDRNSVQRKQVGRIGGVMLLLTDIVDSQVDRSTTSPEDKERYLDAGGQALLFGNSYDFAPTNSHQRASFDLARGLHESVVKEDERALFGTLFQGLISDAKKQLSSNDLEEHLELVQKVGGACALLGAVSTEHVTGTEQLEARVAAASIGAYAACLDHAYEMREDIREGTPTYATLFVMKFGNTLANRRRARQDLLDAGSDAYRRGLLALGDDQRPIYKAACRMLDVRYRIGRHISSMGILGRTLNV